MADKKQNVVWSGIEPFSQFLVPLNSITPDGNNARNHSERNVSVIKHSLREFGQHRVAILDRNGVCIIGNGMLAAAQRLGWTHMAAVGVDDTEAKATLRALVDNQSGLEVVGSTWDLPKLDDALESITKEFDIADFGFAPDEIERMFATEEEPGINQDDGDSDKVKPIKLTAEQREVVNRAIDEVRKESGDNGIPEGRCIELICADFLAGNPG